MQGTEKSPGRSFNPTEDRDSSDDGPDGLGLNPTVTELEVERTSLPDYSRRPNNRTTRLSTRQSIQQPSVKKRKHEGGKQEQKKMRGRRSMKIDTEYKARQDLEESDADGTKLYSEYKRGELPIHGEDTYKKIKLDLKAINDFLDTTQYEPAPPQSNSSVNNPVEQYITPLSDEETQASYQTWIHQLKAKKKQRQLEMLHDKIRLQKDLLPPGLTFEQFWARMKNHSKDPRVSEYLYGQQNHMDHVKHECHITDKRNRIKQKQYMVQWADTYILKKHLPMYEEQGYKVIK